MGVSRIINRRVLELEPLPTPAQVLAELPLTDQAQEIVAYSRDEIRACLYGQDDRLLVIVGPVRFMTRSRAGLRAPIGQAER